MKIRYLAVLYTIFMLVVMVVMLYTLPGTEVKRDMVYYNQQRKQVEEELKQGKAVPDIEEKFSCEILLLTEEDYESHLNKLLQEKAVVFDYYENESIIGKIAWNDKKQDYERLKAELIKKSIIIWGSLLLAGYLLLTVVYFYFIRPFYNLERFSAQVAKGNLDIPLPVWKHNYFGAFTESFDIMREELKSAREREYQANKSKKELVAELSHDIKTPISTIKATCEVLEIKEKNQDTLEKVKVIATKADTIEHLIENMFHAALEELETLKVEPEEESSLSIVEMLRDLQYYGDIVLENEIPECFVWMDKIRMEQVIDNIINNSYKYAKTAIMVSFKELENGIGIQIRDKGSGVPEEEMALIMEKFYRGSNAKGKAGSGLGLYLSKLFMEQMQGDLQCYNQHGFVVELFVKKV